MMDILIFLALVALGYAFGRFNERKHYESIIEREKQLLTLPTVALKETPDSRDAKHQGELVTGSVVISIDYFKRIMAALRTFFGGRVKSYETLIDRARREALLRMKEKAQAKDATAIINIRIETASISKRSTEKGTIGTIEVLAYGTALIPKANE